MVISAIVQAAKDAIAKAKAAAMIRSPSHVMRDEVGVMLMEGMSVSIYREAKATVRTMANVTKYTIDSAGGFMSAGGSMNKTYNQQSTVNLNADGLSVHSDADVRSPAIEIAMLTKRNNRLKGV